MERRRKADRTRLSARALAAPATAAASERRRPLPAQGAVVALRPGIRRHDRAGAPAVSTSPSASSSRYARATVLAARPSSSARPGWAAAAPSAEAPVTDRVGTCREPARTEARQTGLDGRASRFHDPAIVIAPLAQARSRSASQVLTMRSTAPRAARPARSRRPSSRAGRGVGVGVDREQAADLERQREAARPGGSQRSGRLLISTARSCSAQASKTARASNSDGGRVPREPLDEPPVQWPSTLTRGLARR